jgi:predicted phage terminase large subunit-like protein
MSTCEMKTKEKVNRILDDLYGVYHVFVGSDYSNVSKPDHIRLLAKELTGLKENGGRLCVSMPPRHSKSSMVTLAYPLWLIWGDPNLDILIVNSSAGLSENFGIRLRDLFKRYEEDSGVFLSDVKHSSTHLKFQDRNGKLYSGSIRLVGATGSITGSNADYLIIDDPYKGFEDITPSLLEKKVNWFNNIILQRLEPTSRLIICHTRWSENDLQGYLHTNHEGEYKFLSFPAIQEDGTSLWSERYTTEFLEQRRQEMGSRLFEAIYQQKPLDETSDFFKLDSINFEPSFNLNDVVYSVRAWDIASGETKHDDYTAGVLMHKTKDDRYIVTDLVHGHFGGDNLRIIQNTAMRDGANTRVYIETGVAGAGQLLFKEWKQQLKGYRVTQAKPVRSKVDRATPLQNAVLDGKLSVYLDDTSRSKFIKEFKGFPDSVHDDIVDATAHAFNYLHSKSSTLREVPASLKLW